MADLSSLLAVLERDPDDARVLDSISNAARHAPPEVRTTRFASARKLLSSRGRPDIVVHLIDLELGTITGDTDRQADLLTEKATLLDAELLDVPGARATFAQVLAVRPNDATATEALDDLEVSANNWQKYADKFIKEARAATDRSLATGLYVSAAEAYVRFASDPSEAEPYLRQALEIDPRNTKAAFHLIRLLRRAGSWGDLVQLLEQRAEQAAANEEKIAALLMLADVARNQLGAEERAATAVKRVLSIDAAQPQALRAVTDALAATQDWPALVATYQAALRARRDQEDLGILLQIAMVLWKHLGDLDQAEDYFRRVRKLEPAHPVALDFYRAYYPARGEHQKLLALLRQVEKARPKTDGDDVRPINIEIAVLAEAQNNPEKAIEAWKQHLRQEPGSIDARLALARLYRRTEKWNALLDLMKEEIERIPESDIHGRVEKLHEVVEIYRDKLRLDVMVINTYNAILKIDPDNRRAGDELAAKYRALGRWNDLIAVLTRKSEVAELPDYERVALLREIADLWSERFGNFANAIKPLERILELMPAEPEALRKLKEIYTKRRQWRALIDVLGREASMLPTADKRAKQGEMARLAAERLGDVRLAIEIYNTILIEAGPSHPETLMSLAALYEREKRYVALAEILERQAAAMLADGPPANPREAIALLEKLGQIYSDRLGAPGLAAEQWQKILQLEPAHARALRTLRELYATAGDFVGLENLYARLGQEEELVDALLGIADRLDAKAQRLPLVERAAQLAQLRAGNEGTHGLERARQVWERVLAIEPNHLGAATALAPIYARQEKWARLITVHEIELAAATDLQARLAKIAQIRQLCEQKLSSRTLAFTWTMRAFDLDPHSDVIYTDLLRLASEPEHWREIVSMFDRHLARPDHLDAETRLKLFRELARIATRRLGDPERARGYHREVLALAPDDRAAEQALEEIATQLADWPELLASYRRRADREQDTTQRAALLIDIAALQEEKLVDLDGAAVTYQEALSVMPGQLRALRALAKIEEARGNSEALVGVLTAELEQLPEGQAKFDLLMRIGQLEEHSLERPARALAMFREALTIPGAQGRPRPQAVAAIVRYLSDTGPGAVVELSQRVAAARLVLPHIETARDLVVLALEVIRRSDDTTPIERTDLDRALMRIYHVDLGDPAAAWTAGLRVLAADPADAELRQTLGLLAGQLGRDGEWASQLQQALDAMRANQGPSAAIRAIATELAVVATRLGERAITEHAWLTVLGIEKDAADAFDALIAAYRAELRWTDLRALLERRAEVTLDDRVRRSVLLDLAALEDGVLGQPGLAVAAHRRVLDLDPTHLASYQALERLYVTGQQWQELEELLARQADHTKDQGEQIQLAFRRAELFAHRLDESSRAVDLLEDVLGRQRDHAAARSLLEQLMPRQDVTLRVARLLEPIYEQQRAWGHLIDALRAQRSLTTGVEAIELLSRIAGLEEGELAEPGRAFEAWGQVLDQDPAHERARNELVRLANQLGRWDEATFALETAVERTPPEDVTTRVALVAELAAYYDVALGDAPRAIGAYRRLLELDPSTPGTIRRANAALARLYEQSRAWPDLRTVMRKQAEWAEAPAERHALLARVAALEEEQLADPGSAIATWRDVLTDQPFDAGALNALERLYQGSERWRELIEVLQRKLERTSSEEAIQLLARIAEIYEARLVEPDEAIASHLDILDRDPNNARSLAELARLYRSSERHADLLDVLERQASANPGGRLPFDVEIARLLGGSLSRPVEALERWANVLYAEPHHAQAMAAVEASLGDPDLRVMAADILRPVYDGTGQHERLAQLQLRVADWTEDAGSKLRALHEVVRLREQVLADKAGAFEAQLLALGHAATEPELGRVVAETERLAGELGREAELIHVYQQVAPNVLDSEIQRRLYLDIADLSRAVRRDLDLARQYYQKVLDAQPDDRRALVALESIYRETNDHERLTEVLLRQAEHAAGEVDERVGALVEAAELYLQLQRPEDAISTWEQVLTVAPERRDAVAALETLYREQGRWPDVVDLYERRLGFATSVEEAVGLRFALGEIYERQLHDVETAIDNYAAALSGDPQNAAALAAVERFLVDPDLRLLAAEVLEPIYVGQARWLDLIKLYEVRIASASDPEDRMRVTRYVARLYEEQLEDFENASKWYAKLFREAPEDAGIRDQLQRLATVVDNYVFVASVYQEYLDTTAGESEELRDIAISAAVLYDRKVGDADRAYQAYRRALSIPSNGVAPDERELVRLLEDVLGRARKWNELITIYEDVIAHEEDDLRREALVKRARLFEGGLGDPERAIAGWREVVAATEDSTLPADQALYGDAVLELERLYRAGARWHELVDLFQARLDRALGAADRAAEAAELRLRLADVYETNLRDVTAAIEHYEQAIEERTQWEAAVAALERLIVEPPHRERIAEILEPVYREQDWWQKLVVILDAKLDYITNPYDQVGPLHEIAKLHEERGGALELALKALARAWRVDVADEQSLAKLLSLASRLRAWDETAMTIEAGASSTENPDLAAVLWARAAEIHEVEREDLHRAITAWRNVEQTRPDDLVALAALDRLLALVGNVEELVKVIARRAELTDDAGVRLVLLHRVAALYDEVLADRISAIAAYRNVLAVDDTDLAALDGLERLHQQALDIGGSESDARELVTVLERKIELTAELPARQELRYAAARVYERLADIYQAIGQLTAALDDDASAHRALIELDRIYVAQKMWPELLDILDRRASIASATLERADLSYRAARLVEVQQADPSAAIPRYGAVLQMVPAHTEARAALEALVLQDEHVAAASPILERIARLERDVGGLIRVYERRIAAPSLDATARRADWTALAEVYETLAGQPEAAFAVWSRAIGEDPSDSELLAPMLRIAQARNTPALWRELAARLDTLLGEELPPDVEYEYAMQLGRIAEDQVGDLALAARAYGTASNAGEPLPALAALERVLARANRWDDLATVLQREADAVDDDAQIAELLFRLGDLKQTNLRDVPGAVAAYRGAIESVPSHPRARAALESLLASAPEHRLEIVDVLEPLFEQDGDAPRLVTVLESRFELTTDMIDRSSLLARIAEISEHRLNDRGRALDAVMRWLAIDPASDQALSETERLAERLGQWLEVATRLQAIVDAPDASSRERDVQAALLSVLGRIQRERLGQLDEAAATYRAALALEPDGSHAAVVLEDLIKILRMRGDQRDLAEALRQRGRVSSDLAERRAALAEVAQIAERAGDRTGAIAAWRELIDADDADRGALDEVARLYRMAGDREPLIEVLTLATRVATNADDEKSLRVEIAQLESDGPRAVAAWQSVLDLDPDDPGALARLQAVYARASDWMAVADVQGRRLSLATTPMDQIEIHAEMANVAEQHRGAIDDAVSSWYAVLDIDATNRLAYAELERLLPKAGRAHDLVDVLENLAKQCAARGDTAGEIAALARAADVWEGQLDNPDAAGEILEKILERAPGSVAALTRLSKIYERAGDWEKCKGVLEQAIKVSPAPTGRDAADLFFRLGEVARVGDADVDTAMLHFQQALRHEPSHPGAIGALEKLARERKDGELLADMLRRRVATIADPNQRVGVLVELADLERRANRIDAALGALAQATVDAPNDVRVLAPLADLYFAAGRYDEAAPIYDRLAEDAKAGRRMKEVGRFRQRQGGILIARGDRAGAIAAYEEALRVNPTDVTTMTGLGRIYLANHDWEKARRIYQSLVLQNIDSDAGLTKGEVYWALGKIHLELGQPPKAKSMFQRGLELEPQNQMLKDALAQMN